VSRGPDGRLHYYLWNGADSSPTLLADDYPAATLGIYNLMPKLLELVGGDAVLCTGLRAANFLSVKDGSSVVVSLIYDAPLPGERERECVCVCVCVCS